MYEVKKCNCKGYNRVIEYADWVVANLASCEDTNINSITSFQKHLETDEVFILLEGKACLIVLEGDKFDVNNLTFINLEYNKCYNIKKNTFHQHILGDNSNLCIIENSNTSDELNSVRIYLTKEEIENFIKIAEEKFNV